VKIQVTKFCVFVFVDIEVQLFSVILRVRNAIFRSGAEVSIEGVNNSRRDRNFDVNIDLEIYTSYALYSF